ncbi:MAG: DUF2563 family protein [Actinomycetota bacterium]|uniref:DUF2563 family protein n=1 Tax=Mycobacterium lentiflavum TaxID=141349 RepID=A0ABY3UPD7_MYCLN|nr:DUF2563 family protein [Mycobacterium lentiflavum]MEE3065653.1 DUF2563 family protein [Actinomycetota bacterium]ULP40478.1 DUF2563 family protein [Mycobacterium lentiflavum]
MFVDTGLLHSGGSQTQRAGGHAQDAADRLARGPVMSGMFGDFSAADAFHDAVSVAHGKHVKNLQAHGETLIDIGGKAFRAATGFTDMESHNSADLRAVRPDSVT